MKYFKSISKVSDIKGELTDNLKTTLGKLKDFFEKVYNNFSLILIHELKYKVKLNIVNFFIFNIKSI